MNWIQAIAPPLLMLLGGIITWFIKSRTEELRATEKRLEETRRQIYIKILEPYITMFTDISTNNQNKAIESMLSKDYKKTAFELALFGSDSVISAYNKLMQHTYKAEATGKQEPEEMMKLWGSFLLEIRKSLGNKKSKLDEIDMLKFMIKDIDKLK